MTENRREQDFSAEKLLHVLESCPAAGSYIVGFSGGADSTALLHALSGIRNRINSRISAVHINHGIHKDADAWQSHCQRVCRHLDIELHCIAVKVTGNTGKGIEAEARTLRYRAITALLDKQSALLTAHHADDQAETLFLHLMRGSGVDGLSAMPQSRALGDGMLQRPLLGFTRSQLLKYLAQHNIPWIEDPSNQHMDHDRNFVRQQVMPMLEQRFAGITRRLLLTRNAMADARVVLEKSADRVLNDVLVHPLVLQLDPALTDDPAMLKLIIRRWTGRHSGTSLPAYRLEDFVRQVTHADRNSQSLLRWGTQQIRYDRNRLWLIGDTDFQPITPLEFEAGSEKLDLGKQAGRLVFTPLESDGETWPLTDISVSSRKHIAEMTIRHGGMRKRLKKLLQAGRIPPWLRDSIPVCHRDGEILAVGDWCFESDFEARLKHSHVTMQWLPEHPILKYLVTEQHTRQNTPVLTSAVDPEGAVR